MSVLNFFCLSALSPGELKKDSLRLHGESQKGYTIFLSDYMTNYSIHVELEYEPIRWSPINYHSNNPCSLSQKQHNEMQL